jgi:hypothetical protein
MAHWREKAAVDFDEQAGNLMLRLNRPSAGVQFARHKAHKKDAKRKARNRILRWMTSWGCPGRLPLRMFSMPGMYWSFEHCLLGVPRIGMRPNFSGRLDITAIERERSVYLASLRYMPGTANGIDARNAAISTDKVLAFHRVDFYEFIEDNAHHFDLAWVDFNGQMTDNKLLALKKFWESIDWLLVITVLDARQENNVTALTNSHGSMGAWLAKELGNCKLCDEFDYAEDVAMKQMIFQKRQIVSSDEWVGA